MSNVSTAEKAPTLTSIIETASKQSYAEWEEMVRVDRARIKGELKMRDKLLPIERAALPELEDRVSSTPPVIEIAGIKMPRIDWKFVASSTKKINGVAVPAFAVYRVTDEKPMCHVSIERNGKARGLWHDLEVGSLMNMFLAATGEMKVIKQEEKAEAEAKTTMSKQIATSFAAIGVLSFFASLYAFVTSSHILALFIILFSAMSLTISIISFLVGSINKNAIEDNRRTNGRTRPNRIASDVTIVHRFKGGVLPVQTREKIKRLSQCAPSNNLLLVEESYNWEVENVSYERDLDPLIVYYDKNHGAYYLVDKFDLSPLEKFLAQEATFA